MKISPVDLNLIAVLDAILQTGSVSRAAEEVGISKPAMSHALARLRAQMGDPILVRAGQQWQLSERAVAIRERVRELAQGTRAVLRKEATFEPEKAAREFAVHATDAILAVFGSSIGSALARQAPSCTLRFLPLPVDDASSLRGGHIDLALGVFSELPPELRTQSLLQERFACVVRRDHPDVAGKITLKAFLDMKHVLVAPRGKPGSPVDDALAARGLSRQVMRFVPYFVVALDLVSRSDCALTISERVARAYAEPFGLQVLRPPIPLSPYTIRQVWHSRVDAEPAHRWFRRLVARVAADVNAKPRRAR